MGSSGTWFAVILMFLHLSCFPLAFAFLGHDPDSLDNFVFNHASQLLPNHRTSVLCNVSLPSNFTGMEVSAIRLRSSTFWAKGVNISCLGIPPRVLSSPYTKRLAIVYENLGNWSSSFYHLSGHKLVAPVVGFMVIDAAGNTSQKLNLTVKGKPISIRFPLDRSKEHIIEAKCVRFDPGGIVQFSGMIRPNRCTTKVPGHFSVVIVMRDDNSGRVGLWEWRVIGFVAGLVGLVLVGLIVLAIYKAHASRKLKNMEKEYGKESSFGMKWIGMNKVPYASRTRTLGALETDHES